MVLCVSLTQANQQLGPEEIQKSRDKRLVAYHVAVARHYGRTLEGIESLLSKGIRSDELPLLFALADSSEGQPSSIATRRADGRTWNEILSSFHRSPALFYTELSVLPAPLYHTGMAALAGKPADHWRRAKLSDIELVDLANLRFLVGYQAFEADSIALMRGQGQTFDVILERLTRQKAKEAAARKQAEESRKKSAHK